MDTLVSFLSPPVGLRVKVPDVGWYRAGKLFVIPIPPESEMFWQIVAIFLRLTRRVKKKADGKSRLLE
jgi:hypothetical protein